MKYVRTAGFLIDLRRLPVEHRKLFVLAVHDFLRPAPGRGSAHRCCAMAENIAHSPDWRELLDDLELCLTGRPGTVPAGRSQR
jgi:hypothetical protein